MIPTLRVSTLGGPFCAGTAKARLTARITRYVKAKTGRIALLLVGISQIREWVSKDYEERTGEHEEDKFEGGSLK